MIIHEEIVYTDRDTVLIITTYDNGEQIIVEYTVEEYNQLQQN
jgi:hypothetical protein